MFQPTACAPRILRTLDEICETFGVGRKTVRAWARRGAPTHPSAATPSVCPARNERGAGEGDPLSRPKKCSSPPKPSPSIRENS